MTILKDALASHRVGITISRFTPNTADPGIPVKVIKNQLLEQQDLELPASPGEAMLLRYTDTLRKHILAPGEVLVTLKFVRFFAAFFIGGEHATFAYNNVGVLTPGANILPQFLTLWLRSQKVEEWLQKHASSTTKEGQNLPYGFSTISLTTLVKMPISLPSIDRQHQLVSAYQSIQKEKTIFTQRIEKEIAAFAQHRERRIKEIEDQLSDNLPN